jgi:hypothetical protein
MKVWSALFLFLILVPPELSAESPAVAGMKRKLEDVERNGRLARPDPASTEFSEAEVNAYFASGNIQLPVGVRSVRFQGQPGVVTGNARVDFDQLKAGRSSYNPLLSMFSGVHDVAVIAHAYGKRGEGFVHVDSVSLDDVPIPRFALQLFVEKYLQPKYPNVGLDSRFALPARVDTAIIGSHVLRIMQQ